LSYQTDLNQALAAIHKVLQGNPQVLKDLAPVMPVVMLADSSVNIGVRPWVKVADYFAAAGENNKAIVETFRGRNIVIPFPQREVRLLGGGT
jgi:small conductance mechanosensitive channel